MGSTVFNKLSKQAKEIMESSNGELLVSLQDLNALELICKVIDTASEENYSEEYDATIEQQTGCVVFTMKGYDFLIDSPGNPFYAVLKGCLFISFSSDKEGFLTTTLTFPPILRRSR